MSHFSRWFQTVAFCSDELTTCTVHLQPQLAPLLGRQLRRLEQGTGRPPAAWTTGRWDGSCPPGSAAWAPVVRSASIAVEAASTARRVIFMV